jgi:PPOX class probable F420-dependent enzyme
MATMDQSEEEKFIEDFLARPLIARIATVNQNGQPHVVPVWFGWDGKAIWVSSFASTRKNKDLEHNPRVSIVIDDVGEDGKTKAVIFEGQAEVIKEPREFVRSKSIWIYTRYMGEDGVKAEEPQNWSLDAENRLIMLIPERVITRNN